jgi:MFS family permease
MRFSYGKTFLIGFGLLGVTVIWGIYNAFVPILLAEKFGLEPAIIGFFMTLDNVAALLIQPPVGAWSDRLRTPIGRRMPFILVGAPLGALAFGLIPTAAILPLFVACTSTLLLSMALWRTPVVALMPDVTPSQFRSQANGVLNFMGGIGAIASFFGGAALYRLDPAYPFWMGSALVIVASLLVLLFIREPPPAAYTAGETTPGLIASLREVLADDDRSALRILLAIFFWFLGFAALETFFTLYARNHLGLDAADGARLLGLLSLLFVLFALPSGYLGARVGRRPTIITGILLMAATTLAMFFTPPATLTRSLATLPVLGGVPVIGLMLMAAGVAWALININSLPMVVDMTEAARVGTYTGLYYLFSTFSAIVGPNLNGWIVQLTGNNYNAIMIVAPVFLAVALGMLSGVRRGEAMIAAPAVKGATG